MIPTRFSEVFTPDTGEVIVVNDPCDLDVSSRLKQRLPSDLRRRGLPAATTAACFGNTLARRSRPIRGCMPEGSTSPASLISFRRR